MKGQEVPENIIERLRFLIRSYNDVKSVSVSSKQRILQIVDAPEFGYDRFTAEMDSLKDKISREIGKQLEFWDIWTQWLKHVPGAGPWIAGELIMAYYYKFTPICPECGEDLVKQGENGSGKFTCPACGEDSKGKGNLIYRVGIRTWKSISAWQKYCGRFCDESGKMPKRKKGVQSNWSTRLRTVIFQFGDQVNRQKPDHLYKDHMLRLKEKKAAKHPDKNKGHIHNMARHETGKLFLSHFMQVSCAIEGMEVPSPWIIAHGGHTHHVPPFYWNENG